MNISESAYSKVEVKLPGTFILSHKLEVQTSLSYNPFVLPSPAVTRRLGEEGVDRGFILSHTHTLSTDDRALFINIPYSGFLDFRY